MALYINGESASCLQTIIGGNCQEKTAEQYFMEYMGKLEVRVHSGAPFSVRFAVTKEFPVDGYCVTLEGDVLSFSGGKRGIIYSVFAFLERVGFRFFTPEIETVPKEDIYLTDFSFAECSPFVFRDVLSKGATDKVWSLKQKLNSDLWSTRKFKEADGGGYNFAGIPAHSLTGEYLLAPFVRSNPEFFALKNNVRLTDRMGQICMTNEAAVTAVAKEIDKLLEAEPDRNIISVSQGDNHNFCECESCRAAVQEKGLLRTYFDVIQKIARKVRQKHPDVLIHTLAYADLCETIDFSLDDNIMLQYCYGKCCTHAVTDENCLTNRKTSRQIRSMAEKCSNLFVWNYTNCFKYELFEYPFVHNFRKNIRFFADCGVKGVFNEGMHREHEEADFAVTYELRSYLLAKLMWNPYMSEAEFQHHMEEFCHAFYGEGYYFIIHYLKLFEDYSGECAGYDALKEDVVMGEGNECRASPVIRKEQAGYFAEKANELLDKALLRAEEEQVKRIQKLKTVVLYYELFWTMRNILDHGSRQERQTVITKNEELIQRIFDQKLVITFWGQSRESQNKELETMREIPPSEWNYKW